MQIKVRLIKLSILVILLSILFFNFQSQPNLKINPIKLDLYGYFENKKDSIELRYIIAFVDFVFNEYYSINLDLMTNLKVIKPNLKAVEISLRGNNLNCLYEDEIIESNKVSLFFGLSNISCSCGDLIFLSKDMFFSTILHEFGHFFGLKHINETKALLNIMRAKSKFEKYELKNNQVNFILSNFKQNLTLFQRLSNKNGIGFDSKILGNDSNSSYNITIYSDELKKNTICKKSIVLSNQTNSSNLEIDDENKIDKIIYSYTIYSKLQYINKNKLSYGLLKDAIVRDRTSLDKIVKKYIRYVNKKKYYENETKIIHSMLEKFMDTTRQLQYIQYLKDFDTEQRTEIINKLIDYKFVNSNFKIN